MSPVKISSWGAVRRSRAAFLISIPALLFLGLAAPARASAGFVFVDVTSPVLADTLYAYDKKGVAFQDFDGDGDLDICRVGEGARAISLFRNDGGDVFTDVTAGALAFGGSGSGQTWGDYDNDGDLDLFVIGFCHRPIPLIRNDGGGVFVDVTAPPLDAAANGHSGAWADYDNDGDLDLFYADANFPNHLLRNDGGTFVDVTPSNVAMGGHSLSPCWGDYDNDGDLDLYVTSRDGGICRMFRND